MIIFGYNAKFPGLANKEICGHQLAELALTGVFIIWGSLYRGSFPHILLLLLVGFPVLFVSRSFGHMTSVARNVLRVPKTFYSLVAFFVRIYFAHFTRVTRSEKSCKLQK